MGKKFEDDSELKKLLEEQMIREAEIIEEAIFSDKDFEDYEMTDEEVEASYQKLMEQINASAEDPASSAAEEKTIPLSRKKTIRHTGGKLHGIRVAGIAAACIAGVFAASMTSEGNRQYVVDSVRQLLGEDTRIVVSNNEENDKASSDEYEAIADIENELGVDVPEFMYRPEGLTFRTYNLDQISGTAWLEYEYDKTILILYIDRESQDSSSKIDSLHGKDTDILRITREDIDVKVLEIRDDTDLVSSYIAQWKRGDTILSVVREIKEKFIL